MLNRSTIFITKHFKVYLFVLSLNSRIVVKCANFLFAVFTTILLFNDSTNKYTLKCFVMNMVDLFSIAF